MSEEQPASYARGVRRPWASLPPEVRRWVADQLGGAVTWARDSVGGFSPGCAAVVGTGARIAFCKAVGDLPNPISLELYRRERERLAALPRHPVVPEALAGAEVDCTEGRWTVTLLPALAGRPPRHPWVEPVASAVFDRLGDVGRAFAASLADGPSTLPGSQAVVSFFGRWSDVLADRTDPWSSVRWVRAQHDQLLALDARLQREVVGAVPTHADLRADNVLIGTPATATGRPEVWFVDWAEACQAAAWVDPALLACDLVVSQADRGRGGSMDVDRFLSNHPTTADIDPELLLAMMVGLAATLHRLARTPPPPGLPTIRPWQARCAETLLEHASRTDLGWRDALR